MILFTLLRFVIQHKDIPNVFMYQLIRTPTQENIVEWRTEEWTAEGFQTARNMLEDILTEVIPFQI